MLLYRILITLIAPFFTAALFLRVLRRQETLCDFEERLGFWPAAPQGKVIWLHGASNGELTSARPLIESLLGKDPNVSLLLTCNSVSAKQMVVRWALPRTHIRLAPLDLRWLYRRCLAKMELAQFILIEGDFWPNRLTIAQQMNVPIALVAGRVSASSARNWEKFQNISRTMMQTFDLVCAQDSQSQERLLELGVRSSALGPQISLKSLYDGHPATTDPRERAKFWLAASTHEGEDETLLKAHQIVQAEAPEMRLILAPRHPKRAEQIKTIAATLGLNLTQRSKGDQLPQTSDVFLADTLGEMENWYSAAATCFVAGSLVPKGGHTPFEPMTYECAILHGPHYENFTDAYTALQSANGAQLCETEQEIARAVLELRDPSMSKQQCDNARKALAKTEALEPVIGALCQMSKT